MTLADGTHAARSSTDGDWRATTGEIRSADLYDGCRHRPAAARRRAGTRRASTTAAGRRRAVVPFDRAVIEPRIGAAGPRRGGAAGRAARRGRAAASQLDGGQNIAGCVRLRVRGRARRRRSRCAMRRCSSRTASLHIRSLRSAKATDIYILADDARDRARAAVHVPRLPLRGGRDRRRGPRRGVRGHQQRHAAARRRSTAPTPRLDRLHENVVWSQRDNFVSVPTDCPQRDERLGWTGDAQAFAADRLAPCSTPRRSGAAGCATSRWTRTTCSACPTVVPDVVIDGRAALRARGLGGRGDDRPLGGLRVLRRPDQSCASQLPSMRRWVDSLRAAGRRRWAARRRRMQFGDWLDPDAPVGPAMGGQGRLRPTSPTPSSSRARGSLADAAERRWATPPSGGRARALAERVAARDLGALARPRRHDPDRLRRRAPLRHRARRRSARPSRRPWRDWSASADGRVAHRLPGHPARAARARRTRAASTRRT